MKLTVEVKPIELGATLRELDLGGRITILEQMFAIEQTQIEKYADSPSMMIQRFCTIYSNAANERAKRTCKQGGCGD